MGMSGFDVVSYATAKKQVDEVKEEIESLTGKVLLEVTPTEENNNDNQNTNNG